MVLDFDVEYFFNRLFDIFNSRITEFDHFARIGQNDVVMLFVEIRFFVMGLILTKLMASYKAAFQEQLYRVVKSCPADPVILILHFYVQRFNVEVIIIVVNFLKNGKSFGSFPMIVVF